MAPIASTQLNTTALIGWTCLGVGLIGFTMFGALYLFQRAERKRYQNDECLMSHFKQDSQAGFTQMMINGFRTKKDAFKTSSKAAQNIFTKLNKIASVSRKLLVDEFIANKPKSKGLYIIGARNKRDYNYDEGELASSRAVHMPEFHNEIVTSAWIDGINDIIKIRNKGPIYIGNSITTYERLQKDIDNNKTYVEGDWKKYD
jgi:hypothetical protein